MRIYALLEMGLSPGAITYSCSNPSYSLLATTGLEAECSAVHASSLKSVAHVSSLTFLPCIAITSVNPKRALTYT